MAATAWRITGFTAGVSTYVIASKMASPNPSPAPHAKREEHVGGSNATNSMPSAADVTPCMSTPYAVMANVASVALGPIKVAPIV